MEAVSTIVGSLDAAWVVVEECVGRGCVECAVTRLTKLWRVVKHLLMPLNHPMDDVWEYRWR